MWGCTGSVCGQQKAIKKQAERQEMCIREIESKGDFITR